MPDDFNGDADDTELLLDSLRIALGVAVVKDVVHQMRIDPSFSKWFGLGQATAAELGIANSYIDGKLVPPGHLFDLAWGSLPMGFSWSLYFCQKINESQLLSSLPPPPPPLLHDGAPW